jgi:hypothetical protein
VARRFFAFLRVAPGVQSRSDVVSRSWRRAAVASYASFALVAAFACGCGGSDAPPPDDDRSEAATSERDERRGVFAAGASADEGTVRVGPSLSLVRGARVRELVGGREYLFVLAPTSAPPRDGLDVMEVRSYRPIKTIIGTLAADAHDPRGMVLSSARGKTWALSGVAVAGLRDTIASMPEHDYSRTSFAVRAAPRGASRADVFEANPVPLVTCRGRDDATQRIELVGVKPDDSMLDGFVMRDTGGEPAMGPHVACSRAGATYTCAFDSLGDAWGTSRFEAKATFDASVVRVDGQTMRFACASLDRASLAARSEDE